MYRSDPYKNLSQPYKINPQNRFTKSTIGIFNSKPNIPHLNYEGRNEFISKYWDFIHIAARTYEFRDKETRNATKCLFISLCDLIPDKNFTVCLNNFLNMNEDVVGILLKSSECISFLQTHPDIHTYIKIYKHDFFNYCTENSDKLFGWSYLLHNFYNLTVGLSCITFNQLNDMYNKTNIPKNRWGNSFWFMISHCPIYASEKLSDSWNLSYKSFISGLQWTLPCGECRDHIAYNLQELESRNVSIDDYLTTNRKIFEFSVILHNEVNVMLNKPKITLQEAYNIYRSGY
jgi:hypothetical protein